MEVIRNDLSSSSFSSDDSDESRHQAQRNRRARSVGHHQDIGASRIDLVFKRTFFLASCLGIHVFSRNADGKWSLSPWKIIARIVFTLTCLLITVEAYIAQLIYNLPLWFLIMTLPFWYVTLFSIGMYFSLTKNVVKCKEYIEQMKILKVADSFFVNIRLLWIVGYTLVFLGTVLSLIPKEWYVLIVPYGLVLTIPAFVDTYTGVFIYVITYGFRDLAARTKALPFVTLQIVENISVEWLYLRDTLALHNEITSKIVMGRVILFGMQATGFLFTLTSLTDPFGCLELFLPTLTAFVEAFGRFYVICDRGDILCNAHRAVYNAVVERLMRISPSQAELHLRLSVLAKRLEARPGCIEIYGMGRLGGNMFITTSSLVLSYMLLMLSIKPQTGKSWLTGQGTLTNLEKCIAGANTSVATAL